jgi:ParB family chromosome partitioning protein
MSFQGDSIFWVEVEKIVPNPFQPRREFDVHKLQELSESVRMYGILQPLTVTRKEIQTEDGAFFTQYELIAGERRLRAARLAGMEQVPVIIRTGEDSEQEKLELAIIENLQREDLNAVDRALAFKQLADVFSLSHSQVARKVGRSREYVSNTIRLLGLPDYMLSSLRVADISEGHARTLLMLKDRPEEQDVVYREILLKKLSVREVERIVRKIASDKVRKKSWAGTDSALIEIEREFTDTLGTRVQISKTDFGGKLTIDYFSDEDLQKLLSIVKSQGKITDFHLAGTEEEEGESTTVIQKIVDATPLELVEDDIRTDIGAVVESEAAVSEALENTVVESAGYIADDTNEVVRQSLDTNEAYTEQSLQNETPEEELQREEMKVPPSNYIALETTEVPEEVFVQDTPTAPTTPTPESEPGTPVEEPKPVDTEHKDEEDDNLYSMRNFSL